MIMEMARYIGVIDLCATERVNDFDTAGVAI